jgi:hypothetical protein
MKDPSNPVCRTISTLLSRIGDKWTVLVVQTLGEGLEALQRASARDPERVAAHADLTCATSSATGWSAAPSRRASRRASIMS